MQSMWNYYILEEIDLPCRLVSIIWSIREKIMQDKIVILKGPERIRKRLSIVFGSSDGAGAQAAVEMLLHLLAEECIKGYSCSMEITLYRDGSVGIGVGGRGIFLGSPESNIWLELFTLPNLRSAYDIPGTCQSIFQEHNGEDVDNFDLYAVQCATEFMDIRVCRDGYLHKLHFEKGENVGGLTREPSNEPGSTYIHLLPDASVFSQVCLQEPWITQQAKALALCIPGTKILLRLESAEGVDKKEFFYPAGIADYLLAENQSCTTSAVYVKELEAEGQERYNKPKYAAKVKLGLCFTKEQGYIKCYHNLKELSCGGTHQDVCLQNIRNYLEWMLDGNTEKLLKHLTLVIISEAKHTAWISGNRNSIENTLIRDMTEDMTGEDLRYFVKQNRAFLAELFCK